ncbi:hypothetical protein HSB1_12610 [Halogranum salarium B-1]|uniref:Uncharacterized protein n=1 Tax=Halogranum salarium B-1 TaxID=1210908 RepID=J3A5C6_9EURY|nr:hypothetical protein HSB1_12610 [Halogranum salarium B-1]
MSELPRKNREVLKFEFSRSMYGIGDSKTDITPTAKEPKIN